MSLKIDINEEITTCLSAFIKANLSSLAAVKQDVFSKEYFYEQKIPNNEQIHSSNTRIIHLSNNQYQLVELSKQLLKANTITNSIVYPPSSCMTWHTNSDDPGTRIYYSYTRDLSIFRYKDLTTNQIIDDVDNIGWTARKFEITDSTNPFWHTIWTKSLRFSFGFKL